MIDKIKLFFSALIAIVIATLGGYGYIQKKRADKNAEEVDELEKQLEIEGYNYQVKEFQAINKERKDKTDENIKDIKDTTPYKLEPNTTY